MVRTRSWLLGALISGHAGLASAADNLTVQMTKVDRPTLVHLGVQVMIADDDDRDATIAVRFRELGAPQWREGPPLIRVRAELVTGMVVAPQFAGTVFGLRPDTDYELELHAQDPDGLDETWTVQGRTRRVPGDPQAPNPVAVSDTASLKTALGAAKAGDVITLADGAYAGPFEISASGTAEDPIVIRGTSTAGTVLGGGGCEGCNVIEVYGSFVHIERLTIEAASRALRFQTAGAQGNVVRRVKLRDVRLGIGAREDQLDFYICDNELEGRLKWPQVYSDDGGMLANEDGIVVMGSGHVVCHNRLIGFGDGIKMEQDGARAVDIYGNLTLSAYDNAIELDGSSGNTRALANMLVNSYSPLSFQPILGGPAYALRNVVVNVADEQQKLHSNLNTGETVGAVIVHNTFVSPRHAINLHAEATAHAFALVNNLYVGPAAPEDGKVVDWSVPIDAGVIDNNGWYPDGRFDFGAAELDWPSFAAMQAAGVFEGNGVLLTASTFASGLMAPADYKTVVAEPDATLAQGSPAVDAAMPWPGINGAFVGAGPDLGALELGCAAPIHGPRPEGVDEATPAAGCGEEGGTESGETSDGDSTDTGGDVTSGTDGGVTGTVTSVGEDGETCIPTEGCHDESNGTGPSNSSANSGPEANDGSGEGPEESGCGCRGGGQGSPFALLVLLAGRRGRGRRGWSFGQV